MYLRIENPCNENWEKMTPIEKTRFCDACRKKVHDFSSSSFEEIKEVYNLNKGEVCGRVSVQLLNDQYRKAQLQQHYYSHLRPFCLAVIVCFGASLFTLKASASNAFSNLKENYFSQSDTITVSEIKGVVRDKANKELLPFCNVAIVYNDSVVARTTSDFDGKFSIKMDVNKYPEFTLRVDYVGYKSIRVTNIKPSKKIQEFELEAEAGEMMGIMIIDEQPPQPDLFLRGKTIKADEFRRMPK